MTPDLPTLHDRALAATRDRVGGVGADQWDLQSVDDDWDVRTLVNHIVAGNLWVPELVGGRSIEEVGDALDGDLLGDDPLAAYDRSAQAAREGFARPGAMEAMVGVSYGPLPGAAYCGHRFLDVLVHGWDVAASTGQDRTLDPELVQACWDGIQPELPMLTASGVFGTGDVVAPPDADLQTQLLAALGRRA